MKKTIFYSNILENDKILEGIHLSTLNDCESEKEIDQAIMQYPEYRTFYISSVMFGDDNGESEKKLNNLIAKKKITHYLASSGYLYNPKYAKINRTYNSFEIFYFNISALMRDVDLKAELYEAFKGKGYDYQIEELCDLSDTYRCPSCGVYEYERFFVTDHNDECFFCKYNKQKFNVKIKPLCIKGQFARALKVKARLQNEA